MFCQSMEEECVIQVRKTAQQLGNMGLMYAAEYEIKVNNDVWIRVKDDISDFLLVQLLDEPHFRNAGGGLMF